MKQENKFKIVKRVLRDEYGKKLHEDFTIKVLKTFIGLKYWSDLTKKGELTGFEYPITFKTKSKAKQHIKKLRKLNTLNLGGIQYYDIKTIDGK